MQELFEKSQENMKSVNAIALLLATFVALARARGPMEYESQAACECVFDEERALSSPTSTGRGLLLSSVLDAVSNLLGGRGDHGSGADESDVCLTPACPGVSSSDRDKRRESFRCEP